MKEIIIAMLGGGVFVFLEFLIRRWDNKHSAVETLRDDIKKNSDAIEEVRNILIKINEDNKTQTNIMKLQSKELMGLGHDKIIFLTNKIARRGCITLKEKTNLESLYVPYSKLGGNGDGKTGYEYCMKLNVVTDEEANELDLKMQRQLFGIDKVVKYDKQNV